ncbi:hypothetical protein HOI18_01680 [Candidatus Uhrbacteria bacterium]|nr:hypothetical protein [Candidatus Uhrbacteria bacterium]
MKYKILFFDCDGVLIKNALLFRDVLIDDYSILPETTKPFFTGSFRQCSTGQADLKEELVKVIDDWGWKGWKGTVDELIHVWFTNGTKIEPEVTDYIKSLRTLGYRCFLTTDQELYRGEHLKELLGNGKVFEDVFYSGEVGHSKKTEPFWKEVFSRLEKIGLSHEREETAFIDDDTHKVEAVSKLGINTLLYTDLNSLKDFLN